MTAKLYEGISVPVTQERVDFENTIFAWHKEEQQGSPAFCEVCARNDFCGRTTPGTNTFEKTKKKYEELTRTATTEMNDPTQQFVIGTSEHYVCAKNHHICVNKQTRAMARIPVDVNLGKVDKK